MSATENIAVNKNFLPKRISMISIAQRFSSKTTMLLALLFLFTLLQIDANQQFAFHQFENFVQNAKTYKQELILIDRLKNIRTKLETLKTEISQRKVISINQTLEDLQAIENVIEVPQEQDIYGAFRGLLFLQDTYQLDPSKWSVNLSFASKFKIFDTYVFFPICCTSGSCVVFDLAPFYCAPFALAPI